MTGKIEFSTITFSLIRIKLESLEYYRNYLN